MGVSKIVEPIDIMAWTVNIKVESKAAVRTRSIKNCWLCVVLLPVELGLYDLVPPCIGFHYTSNTRHVKSICVTQCS